MAAYLHRLVRRPVLVAGGTPEGSPVAEAAHMARVLEHDFRVPVQWREERSNTTAENARHARAILKAAGVHRIYLVTHAWHMPRARLAFERAGFEVVPQQRDMQRATASPCSTSCPMPHALRDSDLFFRELIGLIWYRLQFAVAQQS